MELFACLMVLIFVKCLEWSVKLVSYLLKLCVFLVSLPFKMLSLSLFNNSHQAEIAKKHKQYHDPIEKMEDHWDNHPEDLDLEDIFWLDELIGDD